MKLYQIFFVVFLSFLWGCENPNQTKEQVSSAANNPQQVSEVQDQEPDVNLNQEMALDQTSTQNPFHPFYIFEDKGSHQNHYIPSGFMPDGKCISFNDAWKENCHSGDTCIKIDYDTECSQNNQKWAGIYWLNPANNWGKRKGGFNLTGADKLIFWAKGEKGGEQIQEFTVGGISGDYPDSDTTVIGPVILTPEWKEYTVDLRGKDLSYISGGFAWTTNVEVNPSSCVFYLDDIRFE